MSHYLHGCLHYLQWCYPILWQSIHGGGVRVEHWEPIFIFKLKLFYDFHNDNTVNHCLFLAKTCQLFAHHLCSLKKTKLLRSKLIWTSFAWIFLRVKIIFKQSYWVRMRRDYLEWLVEIKQWHHGKQLQPRLTYSNDYKFYQHWCERQCHPVELCNKTVTKIKIRERPIWAAEIILLCEEQIQILQMWQNRTL